MIPNLDVVLAANRFLARRYGLVSQPDNETIEAALSEAEELAGGEADQEPAALFCALTQRPRALRSTWRTLPRLLALNQVLALDLRLRTTDEEWRSLRLAVAARDASYQDVHSWFAARVQPR